MAENLERLGIPLGQDGDRGVGIQGTVEIPHLAVDSRGHCRSGQPWSDAFRDLPRRRARRGFPLATVRKGHLQRSHRGDSCTEGGTAGFEDGAK
jgi:hypothetical protein